MRTSPDRRSFWLDRLEQVLDSTPSRLALSFLIVLSVLPERVFARLLDLESAAWVPWAFLLLFAPEVATRILIFFEKLRERRAGRWEAILLVLDFVAVLSFLPWDRMVHDLEILRLFRLGRLLLLAGYWGGVVRDLWSILAGRERRRQVVFVLLGGLLLSFACAVVLSTVGPQHDFDNDGLIGSGDRSFPAILWWSFRQVQDPGNLVERPDQAPIVVTSLLLTFGGLLLFSFLIGVGTSAVEELVAQSRLHPVGIREHTVVLGVGPHSHFLLLELAEITRKNFGALRAAILGKNIHPPDYLRDPRLRAVRYRQGEVDDVEDVARLDLRWASRAIVLGDPGVEASDAQVISSTLAVRSLEPKLEVYPVLEHEKSFPAVRAAGGPGTRVVAAGSFLGYYLAQNVLEPGVFRLFRQLLTSAGCEIYTYVFTDADRAAIRSASPGRTIDLKDLHRRAFVDHGVTLIGLFVAEPGLPGLSVDDLEVLLHLPDPVAPEGCLDVDGGLRCAALRGLIGISLRFKDLRNLARRIVGDPAPAARPTESLTETGPLVAPAVRVPERVLVCGGSPRVPRLLDFLARSGSHLEATILVRDRHRIAPLAEEIERALEGNLSGMSEEPRFEVTSQRVSGGFDLRRSGAPGPIWVALRRCDWTDVSRFLRHPGVDLAKTDAILFLPHLPYRGDTDGLVALDCLRMAQLAASGRIVFRPGCRVVGLVEDPAKGDLLEERLDTMEDADGRFTIIASERVRHHYVMQNVFVPGLHRFYFQMVQSSRIRMRRLLPAEDGGGRRSGPLDLIELFDHLAERGMTFLGLESSTPTGARDVLLDPHELCNGFEVRWEDVRAIYVFAS